MSSAFALGALASALLASALFTQNLAFAQDEPPTAPMVEPPPPPMLPEGEPPLSEVPPAYGLEQTPPPPPFPGLEQPPANSEMAPLAPSPPAHAPEPVPAAPERAQTISPAPDHARAEPAPAPSTLPEAAPAVPEAPPAAPEVAAAPPAAEPEPSHQSETQAYIRIPPYQLAKPRWGVEVEGSAEALGKTPAIPGVPGGKHVRAVMLQMEYQPQWFQRLGVFGFGPQVAVYPVTPSMTATGSFFGIYSGGLQARYQARFLREQIIVPMGGFEARYINYGLLNGPKGHIIGKGAFLGAMLLLNPLEPSAAADFYVTHGVSRSYLVAELRSLAGNDGTISVTGQSLYFGIRFEY